MKQELAPLKEIFFQPSTIEMIDAAMVDYIDNVLNLFVNTNTGFRKVPVIWAGTERAFLTKNKKETRDKQGAMQYPLISVERISYIKDPRIKGTAWANIDPEKDEKGGSIVIARRIKQNKTAEFANADTKRILGQLNFPRKNEKVVYETISIDMPVYVEVLFNIHLRTLYQQQMNELLQPFMTKTGGINYFVMKYNGHRYESFIQKDFLYENNTKKMGQEERRFSTIIPIKVLGYLIGGGVNKENPKVIVRENVVDVKFPKERIIVGDENITKGGDGFVGISSIFGIKK